MKRLILLLTLAVCLPGCTYDDQAATYKAVRAIGNAYDQRPVPAPAPTVIHHTDDAAYLALPAYSPVVTY